MAEPTETQAAPPAPAISATARLLALPLADLRPSPDNPRIIVADDPKLAELATSLRTLGQIEPIVVRDLSGESTPADYLIMAGERRWRAAKLAGLPTIECKVLVCDDRTALEITVVENMQRSDLSPLEEARGVRRLLDAGWDLADVAAHLGKTASWVTVRARLTDLAPAWIDALKKGKCGWAGVAHLEQIARLPVEAQEDILARHLRWGTMEISAKELAREITDSYLHLLNQAPWKLDDADLLPAAGACTACPHRSSCQTILFGDVGAKDRCLNATCWADKVQAHTARQAAALQAKHATVVVLADARHGVEAPAQLPQGIAVVRESYNLSDCKRGDPGAMPVLHADSGRTTWARCSEHAPAEVKKALGATIKAPKPGAKAAATAGASAETNLRRRQAKRFAWRFQAICETMEDSTRPASAVLLRLVALLLIGNRRVRDADTWEEVDSAKRTEADDLDDCWAALRRHIDAHIGGQVCSTALPDLEAVQAIERLMHMDPEQQAEKALREIPEPEPKRAKPAAGSKVGSSAVAKPKKTAATAAKARKPAKRKGVA